MSISTMSTACLCGIVCKNQCDQKTHQAKMGCSGGAAHRSRPWEDAGWARLRVILHILETSSSKSLHSGSHPEHCWFMWPAANKQRKWMFGENVDGILEYTAKQKEE